MNQMEALVSQKSTGISTTAAAPTTSSAAVLDDDLFAMLGGTDTGSSASAGVAGMDADDIMNYIGNQSQSSGGGLFD